MPRKIQNCSSVSLSKLTMQWIAIGLDFVSMALEWVSVKLRIRVLPGFVFSK